MYFEYHRGVMTSQANHKRNMRESSIETLNAEKWASLAWLDGQKYPAEELTEDWKKVLFNQFHDLAAGSGIGIIYKDAQKDYDVVRWSTNEIDVGAQDTLISKVNTAEVTKSAAADSLVIFNSLGWKRSGTVAVHIPGYPNGFTLDDPSTGWHAISFRLLHADGFNRLTGKYDDETYLVPISDVPALGYKALRLTPGCHEKTCNSIEDRTVLNDDDLKPSNHSLWLDNDNLHIKVDAGSGCITSIVDKKSGIESIATGSCGNQLQFFKDTPKDYDAWNIDPGTLDQTPAVIEKADSVGYFEGADYTNTIRITRHWQNSKFSQTIRLRGDQVDIENDIDWHESHVLLKAAFPLAASGPFATYEIPYGTIDRPTTRNNSWEKAQFEVPAQQWADLGDGKHGLSLINDSKFGYDAVGNTLRLTLLRSPKWPDPDADMGHHHFHYALYPHAGTWKDAMTIRRGFEYNYPLTAVVTTAHAGTLPASHSFASVAPENVVLTAVKKAEDAKGLIFRVYEWAGKDATVEFHVPPGATSATVTNMMETPEGSALAVAGDVVKAPIHPYEILTVRVDYPNGGPKE